MKAKHGHATILRVVILLVLATTVVVLAVDRYATNANLEVAKDELARLRAESWEQKGKTGKTIHDLETRLHQARNRFEEARQKREKARESVQELSARLMTCSKELQAKKRDYQDLNADVTELQSSLRSLVQALKQAEVDREMYEKRTADAKTKIGRLQKQARALDNEIARRTRINQELQEEVAHFKNLVETAAKAGYTWPQVIVDRVVMHGTVQSVNKEYRYVTLSLGKDDKVVRGLLFTISRNGEYVGRVRVDHVDPKTCSATIVQIADNMAFQPGDQAATGPSIR